MIKMTMIMKIDDTMTLMNTDTQHDDFNDDIRHDEDDKIKLI